MLSKAKLSGRPPSAKRRAAQRRSPFGYGFARPALYPHGPLQRELGVMSRPFNELIAASNKTGDLLSIPGSTKVLQRSHRDERPCDQFVLVVQVGVRRPPTEEVPQCPKWTHRSSEPERRCRPKAGNFAAVDGYGDAFAHDT